MSTPHGAFGCISRPARLGYTAPMAHAHQHSNDAHPHGHGHGHAPATFDRAFAIGITLNLAFVIAEVAYGLVAHSLALLADA